jgi:acetyl-CoA acetyltransferase
MRTPTDVVIAGVAQTPCTARSGTSVRHLALTAAHAALADAGLPPREVDAIIPVGGSITAEDIMTGLRLGRASRIVQPPPGGNSAVETLIIARDLLLAGCATAVLAVFARNGHSEAPISRRVAMLPGQHFREHLEHPHGWSTPAQWYSMICRRHMHTFGTTKDQMAAVALTMREHARLNPGAMMRGRRLTLAEYHAAPMVAEPYQRFDCCLETDGAAALVLGTSEGPSRSRARAVALRAAASARPPSPDDLTNRPDWLHIGLTDAAATAFASAGLGPEDIRAAMIYDCFTFEVLHQLEEAGFCPRGAAGHFVAAGNARLGGSLPVNTHGGLLSEGHLGGMNHIVEAVRQARREGGRRQVAKAGPIAVTGWGDWGDGSLAILG